MVELQSNTELHAVISSFHLNSFSSFGQLFKTVYKHPEPKNVISYPWGVHEVPDPGPSGEEVAASREEADRWDWGAWVDLPC